jgi:hypothetical protein
MLVFKIFLLAHFSFSSFAGTKPEPDPVRCNRILEAVANQSTLTVTTAPTTHKFLGFKYTKNPLVLHYTTVEGAVYQLPLLETNGAPASKGYLWSEDIIPLKDGYSLLLMDRLNDYEQRALVGPDGHVLGVMKVKGSTKNLKDILGKRTEMIREIDLEYPSMLFEDFGSRALVVIRQDGSVSYLPEHLFNNVGQIFKHLDSPYYVIVGNCSPKGILDYEICLAVINGDTGELTDFSANISTTSTVYVPTVFQVRLGGSQLYQLDLPSKPGASGAGGALVGAVIAGPLGAAIGAGLSARSATPGQKYYFDVSRDGKLLRWENSIPRTAE